MAFQEEMTQAYVEATDIGLFHRFAGVDLAPNEQLETGFSALDRERQLVRMDKLYRDDEIVAAVQHLGPPNGTVVVIDMPKSLSISGRWRQEEIKMHPLRLKRPNGQEISRYERRGLRMYDRLAAAGMIPFLYFNYWTRLNYEMLIPFRSRSPQGCRALQQAIVTHLAIPNLPTNLAPSSVLESIVGAYAAWGVWAGTPETDFRIFRDAGGCRYLVPQKRPHVGLKQRPRIRRFRKYSRANLRPLV